MLQKSKSKTIAKIKYLVILPLMLVMLTIVSCSEDTPEAVTNDMSISKQLAEIKQALDEGQKLTETERNQFYSIMEQVFKDKNFPPPPLAPERRYAEGADVPFAVIDQVPVFPGCENLGSNDAQKECMSSKISEFVTRNFNADLGKELGLTGMNRVIVQFKIDKNGNIMDVRSRAPHPALEVEASRVINSLPQMQPGQQGGQNVRVMYSLPIAFQVAE